MSKWTERDIPDQSGRTFVVTGANSGLGAAAAKALAAKGAHVVMACRNVGNAERVAAQIGPNATVRELDLADLASVRKFADATDTVDVLVNNAGVMGTPKRRTADGFEMQIGTNHLGHFALTNLLLPRIKDRVVTVASGSHRYGKIRLDDLNWEQGYRRHMAYGQAKLANMLFMAELQRRLDEAGSPVRSVGAHPGWAATNLQSRSGNRVEDALMTVGNGLFAQSGDMGAEPTLFAATQDVPGNSYAGPGGRFEMRGHPTLVGRSKAAEDLVTARRLWELSEQLTGVSFPREVAAPV